MRKRGLMAAVLAGMMISAAACGTKKPVEAVSESGKTQHLWTEPAETKREDHSKETESGNKASENKNKNQDSIWNGEVKAEYAGLPESQGFEFESNGDGTCTLSKIGSCTDTELVIPERSPSGELVTKIGDYAFYGTESLTRVVIAGKEMELEDRAFQSCEMETLVISGCDLTIGESAFSYCEKLGRVEISGSRIQMEDYAFYESGKKAEIEITDTAGTLDDRAFQAAEIQSLVIRNSTLEVGESVFSYCDDLETVLFESSDLEIGSYAFYESGNDMTVMFSECQAELKDRVFQDCDVVEVSSAGGNLTIGESAFSYCANLKTLTLATAPIEIDSYAFYECSDLETVSIAEESGDDSVEIKLGERAFQSCGAQTVVIGRGNVRLGRSVFSYCENLTSVELKGSTLNVGDYAFYECPETLTILYGGAGYNRDTIEEVH